MNNYNYLLKYLIKRNNILEKLKEKTFPFFIYKI